MAAILAGTCHEVRADLMIRQPCHKTVLCSESEKTVELMTPLACEHAFLSCCCTAFRRTARQLQTRGRICAEIL